MKLPGGDNAIVDDQKLVGYCLDPEHPRGKHKARVFRRALGFTAAEADELRRLLLSAAANSDATHSDSDAFGDRYMVEFEANGPKGSGIIRSFWILRTGETTPRLTSCYVK